VDSKSQFVIIDTDCVIKGPYTLKKVKKILERKKFLTLWDTPHVVLPLDKILHVSSSSGKNEYYMIYPNLLEGRELKYRWYTEKETGLEYRVLKRRGLIQLYRALYTRKYYENWIYKHMQTLLLAIFHCYILGIGDLCLSNILVDIEKYKIYIIDLDDSAHHTRVDEFFYFRSAIDGTDGNEWLHYARPQYEYILDKLLEMLPKYPQFRKRIRTAIILLSRYTYTFSDSSTSSDSSNSSSSPDSSNSSSSSSSSDSSI